MSGRATGHPVCFLFYLRSTVAAHLLAGMVENNMLFFHELICCGVGCTSWMGAEWGLNVSFFSGSYVFAAPGMAVSSGLSGVSAVGPRSGRREHSGKILGLSQRAARVDATWWDIWRDTNLCSGWGRNVTSYPCLVGRNIVVMSMTRVADEGGQCAREGGAAGLLSS